MFKVEQNRGLGKNAWGGGAAGYGGAQNRVGLANPGQARQVKCYNCNGVGHIARNCTQPNATRTPKTSKDKIVADSKLKRIGVVLENSNIVPKLNNDLTRALKPNRVLKAPTYTVADNSLNAELAIYKEQVKLYDRRSQGLKYSPIITPPDYSKENFLATFTPQKQLTPEQLFWSQDIVKMKAKALKEQNTRPIKALTVKCLLNDSSTSGLNVSRILKCQKAHNVSKPVCLELKQTFEVYVIISYKIINSNELLNRFSNLEVNHLNLQLKYQNLKESFQNKPSSPVNDTPDFNSVFVIGQMKASLQGKDNVIQKLKMQISQLKETRSELDRTRDFRALDFQISQLTEKVNVLQEQNELFRAENAKIKQHYKELYDSIKITRAKHIEQITALKNENESLKVQLQNTVSCVTTNLVKPNVLAPGKYAIDVEPIPPRNRNNREVHLVYLRHLKESVDTLREIVEEAKVFNQQDKKHAHTPRKKQVTFEDQIATSSSTTHKHVEPMHTQQSNVPVPPSTGVNSFTDARGSQPRSILKKHKIPPAKSDSMKKVEEHPRTIRSSLTTTNRVDS
ncbi:retrovirus-related pol polyprotein from transposon TNT 1-94 [Tanacetum coccineum]|uniref:Retrovirus-related pol polyprotein from transposon TNT 1-94 n=1 Tax=Tanacetum coccineum TaxID=301880 RepID=A0ABQ4WZ05_9ASTR